MDPGLSRIAPEPNLIRTGVVAILRSESARHIGPAADVLASAGVTCLEVTLTVPGAIDALKDLAGRFGPEVTVGAGTVTSAVDARAAVDAGAAFLVSPAVCADVIAVAVTAGLPCYAGAWTPTEALTAWQSGAAAVKLFPASSGGVAHLRALREPLPDIPFVPTGGVSLEQISDYIRAGALAVGLGSGLLGDALRGGSLDALGARARRAAAEVHTARARLT